MQCKRIVISGGPSSGKTTLINQLEIEDYYCFHEVSRSLIKSAQKKGISQPFLSDPVGFNQSLLSARVTQFKEANTLQKPYCFYDRGIHDILGYMEYAAQRIPNDFIEASAINKYDRVFLLPPWSEIHVQDGERYETLDQAIQIYENIKSTYIKYNYTPLEIPFGTVNERVSFIMKQL